MTTTPEPPAELLTIGMTVVQKTDLGIPNLTLREFRLTRGPYVKRGQTMVTVQPLWERAYPREYPADQFMELTRERLDYLTEWHKRSAATRASQ